MWYDFLWSSEVRIERVYFRNAYLLLQAGKYQGVNVLLCINVPW